MATVQIKRCDRCGRYEDEDDAVVVVVETHQGGAVDLSDLCAPCAEGLASYLGGHKLARNRKTAAVTP